MRRPLAGVLLAGAVLLTAGPAAADVRVTLRDGRVTLSAHDATVRQILTEWARVGQTRIVNVERVSGAPLTLELTDVPEAQALDVILRSISGYLAAPRAVAVPDASQYDRILLLPTSSPAASSPGAARPGPAAAQAPPAFQPPVFQPPAQQGVQPDEPLQDDQGPAGRPGGPPNGFPMRPPPNANPFAQTPPRPDAQEAPAQPTAYPAPTSPFGTAVPGMPVPTPQQTAPPSPGQPRR